jgi:hypothetical protein
MLHKGVGPKPEAIGSILVSVEAAVPETKAARTGATPIGAKVGSKTEVIRLLIVIEAAGGPDREAGTQVDATVGPEIEAATGPEIDWS